MTTDGRSRGVPGRRWTAVLTVLAVALVGVSLAPWFRRDVDQLGPDGRSVLAHSANAWQASTLWSVAVVLAVLAAVLGIAAHAVEGPRRRRSAAAAAALAVVAAGAWLRQGWQLAHPPGLGPSILVVNILPADTSLAELDSVDGYTIARDQLSSYVSLDGLGEHVGPTAASTVGGVLISVILVVLLLVAARVLVSPGPGEPG